MEALFFGALEMDSAVLRAAYLESTCAGDTDLRRQVEKLLDAHSKVGDFLKKPVAEQISVVEKEMPPLAVAPFDSAEAKGLQEASAQHLDVPVETTNANGMKLILIPPAGRAIPNAYYLGKYEVTQGEWERVMENNPSGFGPKNPKVAGMDTSKFPVEQVSWLDSVEFCNKLSEREGLQPYYELTVMRRRGEKIEDAKVTLLAGSGDRIPTEPEWDRASRAGAKATFHFGDREGDLPGYAWFATNSAGRTHTVGEKKPNAFGLYDMQGNVWEWCADEVAPDPTDPKGASRRVFRGGSWDGGPAYCQSASRFTRLSSNWVHSIGLRVARAP